MAEEAKTEEAKARKKAADALVYEGSTTLSKPKKATPPTGTAFGGGGRGGGASDIRAAFEAIVGERDEWFLVAENIGNPGRFYDGFRALGAQVKVSRKGEVTVKDNKGKDVVVPAYEVFAMVPAGEIKPWKKKSSSAKRQELQQKMAANRTEGAGAQQSKKA